MKNNLGFKKKKGFTLIELMVVVVIIAIFAAIAIPSYQEQIRRGQASKATQEMLRLAQELEKHKARNFNYIGFTTTTYSVPNTSYTISIVDGSLGNPLLTASTSVGQSWAMKANANDTYSQKYNFLLTSNGFKCKNKSYNVMTYNDCATGGINEW